MSVSPSSDNSKKSQILGVVFMKWQIYVLYVVHCYNNNMKYTNSVTVGAGRKCWQTAGDRAPLAKRATKKNFSEWHRMCFRSPSQQHAQLTSPRQQSVRTYSIQILFICVPYKMIDSTRSRTAQIHRELNGNVTVHISSLWTAKASPGSFNNRTRSTLACSLSTEKWNFLDASCICLCHWHEWVAASSSSHRSLQKWQGPEGLQSSTVLQSWCLPPAQWRIKFTSSKCPDKIH